MDISEKVIRLDMVEPDLEAETGIDTSAGDETYPHPFRILVPVANPSTQKGLVQLAVALAQPAVDVALITDILPLLTPLA